MKTDIYNGKTTRMKNMKQKNEIELDSGGIIVNEIRVGKKIRYFDTQYTNIGCLKHNHLYIYNRIEKTYDEIKFKNNVTAKIFYDFISENSHKYNKNISHNTCHEYESYSTRTIFIISDIYKEFIESCVENFNFYDKLKKDYNYEFIIDFEEDNKKYVYQHQLKSYKEKNKYYVSRWYTKY